MRIRAFLTIARDVLCLVWGFGGIAIQQLSGRVDLALLTAYMALIGVPGGFAIATLVRGKAETDPTPGSSSTPQRSSSQLPSS